MKILYFAMLRQATGKNEEEWSEPAPTLGDLLRALVKRYGPQFERWVFTDGQLAAFAIVFVNGRDVRQMQRLDTPLSADDTIVIFPPVAGG